MCRLYLSKGGGSAPRPKRFPANDRWRKSLPCIRDPLTAPIRASASGSSQDPGTHHLTAPPSEWTQDHPWCCAGCCVHRRPGQAVRPSSLRPECKGRTRRCHHTDASLFLFLTSTKQHSKLSGVLCTLEQYALQSQIKFLSA